MRLFVYSAGIAMPASLHVLIINSFSPFSAFRLLFIALQRSPRAGLVFLRGLARTGKIAGVYLPINIMADPCNYPYNQLEGVLDPAYFERLTKIGTHNVSHRI